MKPDWCDEKTWDEAYTLSSAWAIPKTEQTCAEDIARSLLTARQQGRDEGLEKAERALILKAEYAGPLTIQEISEVFDAILRARRKARGSSDE